MLVTDKVIGRWFTNIHLLKSGAHDGISFLIYIL